MIERLQTTVDRMEDKLDQEVNHLDKRVGSLERWRSGIVAVGTAVLTYIGFKLKGL